MDEARLVDAAAWAAVGPYRAAPGVVVADSGVVRWFRTGIGFEGLNGVLWARLAERGLDGAIERALAPFREAGVPMLWHVGPTSSPRTLPRALEVAGLAHHESEPGMVADLAASGRPRRRPGGWRSAGSATRTGSRPGPACGPGRRRTRTSTAWSSCARPAPSAPARQPPHLLALLEGAAVACAAVFVGDRRDGPAPAAWVEHVVTVPAARRMGIGTALTHACLAQARTRGLARAVLTASPEGHGIYGRLGFRDRCTVSRYRYPTGG